MVAVTLSAVALGQANLISPEYDGNCQAPTWSRDGAKLAYEVNYHDKKTVDLYVYEPGRNIRQVIPVDRDESHCRLRQASASQVAHQAVWSPPSIGRLIYSSSSTQMDFDLYLERGSASRKPKVQMAIPLGPSMGAGWLSPVRELAKETSICWILILLGPLNPD